MVSLALLTASEQECSITTIVDMGNPGYKDDAYGKNINGMQKYYITKLLRGDAKWQSYFMKKKTG